MDILVLIIISVCFFCFIFCGILYAIYSEYKEFNKGICPKCGKRFRLFDMDSQGGRGYCCNDCGHYVWVSYDCVDKNYRKL